MVRSFIYKQSSLEDYIKKTDTMVDDLQSNSKWINHHLHSVKKDHKIIRWIKSIVSIFIPINLYSSIKASKVAFSVFEWAKTNQEHMKNEKALDKTLLVLTKLDETTRLKHKKKIEALSLAVKALKLEKTQKDTIDDTIEITA